MASDISRSEPLDSVGEQENDINDEAQLLDGVSCGVGEFVGHEMMVPADQNESDGQRRCLRLDDDGGAYFDKSPNLETVVRMGEGGWSEIEGSPVFKELNRDNDILFNPAQKLNFDETEEEDDEDDDKEFGGVEEEEIDDILEEAFAAAEEEDNSDSVDDGNYLHHRPRVNGSDLVQDGAVAAIAAANINVMADQGQNIRIIEGHDSSLLDDGNATGNAFNFNFMQTQVLHLPPMASLASGRSDDNLNEEDGQNLYDSLDPGDGTSPFGHCDQAMDPNTSEYYSGTGSMQTLNSHSQSNSDSFWPPEELAHLRGSTNQGHFFQSESSLGQNSQQGLLPFGGKSSSTEGHGSAEDGSCTAGGSSVPNSQDGFELCEDGLLQGTQMYAQPVTNPNQGFVESSGGHNNVNITPSPKNTSVGFSLHNSNQEGKVYGQSGDYMPRGATAPPTVPPDRENKTSDLAPSKDSSGSDILMDERQAAAGSSSSSTNQNQSAKPKVRLEPDQKKRISTAKTQTRRPAVQGSASSSELAFPNHTQSRLNMAAASATGKTGKPVHHPPSTTKHVRVSAQGGDSISKQGQGPANDGSRVVGNVGEAEIKSSPKYSRQYHAMSTHPSRASSFAALSSLSGTNSRVSGVGKESHYYQRAQNANQSQGLDNQPPINHSKQDMTNNLQASSGLQSTLVIGTHAASMQQLAADQNLQTRSSSHVIVSSQSQHQVKRYPSHDLFVGTSQSQHRITPTDPNTLQHHPHNHQHLYHPYHQNVLASQQQQQQLASNHSHQLQQQPASNHSHQLQLGSPTGSDQSHQSFNRDQVVVTQMDSMNRQPARILHQSESMEPAYTNLDQFEGSVPGMEDVRSHLHSMLNMAREVTTTDVDHEDTATELLLSDQPVNRQLHFDLDTSSLNGNSGPDDMSEILENFPTFSSKMFTEMSSMAHRTDTQTLGENQYLRDSLEKERYRRKHCEQQIQKLNAKLLETQQQLAVAVSTDKRKDLMIEQLDKQLAKVVEGWKKRESEKDVMLRTVKEEKDNAEECLQRQQTMINNFEHDLAQTVTELKEEKEKSSKTIEHLKSEMTEAKAMKEEVEMRLALTADKYDKMSAQWDSMAKVKDNAEKLAQQAQDALLQEENNWKEKEKNLMDKISQVKEANQKVINMEKVKLEEERKKREDMECEASQLKTELKKLVLDAEQLVREKESQKVEMSIMEAKFESAQRKLEVDLHAEMEKEIANQAKEYHSKLESSMEEAGERHRKQISELHIQHQRDLERQMASAGEEMNKKEEEHKKRVSELEDRLAENRNEISNLKQSKLKLESQRMEILSKLQYMMQSQWNEAVSLLVSTPQKKGLSSSFLSSQSGLTMAGGSQSLSADTLNLPSGVMQASSVSQHASATSVMLEKNNCSGGSGSGGGGGSGSVGGGGGGSGSVIENKAGMKSFSNSNNSVSSLSQNSEIPCSWKEGENEEEEEKARMDRVEEYVYRMAIQDKDKNQCSSGEPAHPRTNSSSQQLHHSSSSQGSMTAGSGQGQGNNMISAVVHHSSIPPSQFQAMAIKSPKQMSSRFWNDLGPNVNEEDSGSLAPPPSVANSSTSLHQQHLHHSSLIADDGRQPQQQHQQQRNMHQSQPGHYHHQHHPHPQQQQQRQQQRPQEMVPQRHMSGPEGTNHHSTRGHSKDLAGLPRPFFSSNIGTNMTSSPTGVDSRTLSTSLASGSDTVTMHALSPPVKQSAMTREDLEEKINSNDEDTSNHLPDPTRLQANYSHLSEQVDAHMNRQEELQHYIQMLLQKAPGSVESEVEPERDVLPNDSSDILESSRDLTVDLDLTETAQALEVTNHLTRLQELRERQQQMSHKDGMLSSTTAAPSDGMMSQNTSLSEMMLGQHGVLSSQNLAEISQLLSLYREQWEASPESANQANTAGQLIDALRKGVLRPEHPNTKTTSHDKSVFGTKDSPRGQGQPSTGKKGKGTTKVNKTRWKVGYQSADSSLNGGTDTNNHGHSTSSNTSSSGHHHPNIGGSGHKAAGQGGLAPPHNRKGKSSAGSKVWK